MNRLALTKVWKNHKEFIAYIILNEKREFIDFQLFPVENSLLDNIYIGRVEHISSNISAAFINISDKRKCFLPLEDCNHPIFAKKQSEKRNLSEGDLLLVQVVKDAVKTKDPVVSTNLTLHGKYAVLTTGNTTLGVSKKISKERRIELENLLEEIKESLDLTSYGMVLRTDAAMAEEKELISDIQKLAQEYHSITMQQIHGAAFSCVHESVPGYVQRIKASNFENIDYIYTDCADLFETLKNELPLGYQEKLYLYNDTALSLKALYNIEGNIENLLNNKVWLKSGANLIIEQLETITFIDINTAKNISNKKEVILNVNKEAAKEIARQLRLRNISGMIIVDFINMSSAALKQELIEYLKKELALDVTACQFIDFTKLGLAEITRKKTYASLKEIILK